MAISKLPTPDQLMGKHQLKITGCRAILEAMIKVVKRDWQPGATIQFVWDDPLTPDQITSVQTYFIASGWDCRGEVFARKGRDRTRFIIHASKSATYGPVQGEWLDRQPDILVEVDRPGLNKLRQDNPFQPEAV